MCLQPIKIYNNTHTIYKNQFARLYYQVPCGQCAQCQQIKSTEWLVRSYYQAIETLEKGGYILFDCLTYDNKHIPKASKQLKSFGLQFEADEDFTCFSRRDIQKFLKRLRMQITRIYGETSNIKYFLSSEYGVDERFTHRPHYHILFYVLNTRIKPESMSYMIHESWQNGRTDGVFENGMYQFYQKKVLQEKSSSVIKSAQYVSKYVEKDCEFQEQIDERLKKVYQKLSNQEKDGKQQLVEIERKPLLQYILKQKYNRIKKTIEQFHMQSHGFGMYGLEVNRQLIIDENKVKIPDTTKVVKYVNAFPYYIRKLFQEKVKDEFGARYVYTELGKEYIIKKQKTDLETMLRNIKDSVSNFDAQAKRQFAVILGKRKLEDYVKYMYYYKDRIYTSSRLPRLEKIVSMQFGKYSEKQKIYMWNTPKDRCVYGNAIVSKYDIRNMCRGYCDTTDHYFKKMLINQDTFVMFNGFDQLTEIIRQQNKRINRDKQETYKVKQQTKKRLKALMVS